MTKKKKEFKPVQGYMLIGAGVCLIILGFLRENAEWSTFDKVKVGVGILSIAVAIFELTKKRS